MVYEFEGKSEKEAIDRAVEELSLSRDSFDVEILESKKGGIFRSGTVRIRVHTMDGGPASIEDEDGESAPKKDRSWADAPEVTGQRPPTDPKPQNEFEQELLDFVMGLVERMGYEARARYRFRESGKVGIELLSRDSSALIGRKGKTLDAMQLLAMIWAGSHGKRDLKVILDSEGYRLRREEALVKLAFNMADRVRSSRGSILLEPMNPFDRRIIHTTLSDSGDVGTESEGDGLYKQVRIFYRR